MAILPIRFFCIHIGGTPLSNNSPAYYWTRPGTDANFGVLASNGSFPSFTAFGDISISIQNNALDGSPQLISAGDTILGSHLSGQFTTYVSQFNINGSSYSIANAPVTISAAATTVPEPASIITWSLLGFGMIGGSWYHRRRKQHLAAC